MSYGEFKEKINAIIANAGLSISASFTNDEEKESYIATFPEMEADDTLFSGTQIIGRPSCHSVFVKFGKGHIARATL